MKIASSKLLMLLLIFNLVLRKASKQLLAWQRPDDIFYSLVTPWKIACCSFLVAVSLARALKSWLCCTFEDVFAKFWNKNLVSEGILGCFDVEAAAADIMLTMMTMRGRKTARLHRDGGMRAANPSVLHNILPISPQSSSSSSSTSSSSSSPPSSSSPSAVK